MGNQERGLRLVLERANRLLSNCIAWLGSFLTPPLADWSLDWLKRRSWVLPVCTVRCSAAELCIWLMSAKKDRPELAELAELAGLAGLADDEEEAEDGG